MRDERREVVREKELDGMRGEREREEKQIERGTETDTGKR